VEPEEELGRDGGSDDVKRRENKGRRKKWIEGNFEKKRKKQGNWREDTQRKKKESMRERELQGRNKRSKGREGRLTGKRIVS